MRAEGGGGIQKGTGGTSSGWSLVEGGSIYRSAESAAPPKIKGNTFPQRAEAVLTRAIYEDGLEGSKPGMADAERSARGTVFLIHTIFDPQYFWYCRWTGLGRCRVRDYGTDQRLVWAAAGIVGG
jgi:hypothetical protein